MSADLDIPLLLNAQQLVDLLPLGERTVYQLLREGKIRGARKIGRQWVIHGWWRIVRAAKVTELSFHHLRHTFASHCIMRGVPVEVLQQWLGHSDIRQTMRYAHLAPDHSDRFVQLLNEAQTGEAKNG